MKRVLSIDGGGIRGVIPAAVLVELERRSGKKAWDLFDLVAGTSTGGIIACGLARGVPAQDMLDVYLKHGSEIFSRRWRTYFGISGPRYSDVALRSILERVLGAKTLLSEVVQPELLVVSYFVSVKGKPELGKSSYHFKSYQARGNLLGKSGSLGADYDFKLVDVCLATSAAPTYFPTAKAVSVSGLTRYMIDGGMHENNPVLAAVASAMQRWPGEEIRALSLGTGANDKALDGEASRGWGAAAWARHLLDVAMDGTQDDADYHAEELPGFDVDRVQTILPENTTAMDDASPDNLDRLRDAAAKLIALSSASLGGYTTPIR